MALRARECELSWSEGISKVVRWSSFSYKPTRGKNRSWSIELVVLKNQEKDVSTIPRTSISKITKSVSKLNVAANKIKHPIRKGLFDAINSALTQIALASRKVSELGDNLLDFAGQPLQTMQHARHSIGSIYATAFKLRSDLRTLGYEYKCEIRRSNDFYSKVYSDAIVSTYNTTLNKLSETFDGPSRTQSVVVDPAESVQTQESYIVSNKSKEAVGKDIDSKLATTKEWMLSKGYPASVIDSAISAIGTVAKSKIGQPSDQTLDDLDLALRESVYAATSASSQTDSDNAAIQDGFKKTFLSSISFPSNTSLLSQQLRLELKPAIVSTSSSAFIRQTAETLFDSKLQELKKSMLNAGYSSEALNVILSGFHSIKQSVVVSTVSGITAIDILALTGTGALLETMKGFALPYSQVSFQGIPKPDLSESVATLSNNPSFNESLSGVVDAKLTETSTVVLNQQIDSSSKAPGAFNKLDRDSCRLLSSSELIFYKLESNNLNGSYLGDTEYVGNASHGAIAAYPKNIYDAFLIVDEVIKALSDIVYESGLMLKIIDSKVSRSKILSGGETLQVVPGQNLRKVAAQAGISDWTSLAKANGLVSQIVPEGIYTLSLPGRY
jgi:hypothetical protein